MSCPHPSVAELTDSPSPKVEWCGTCGAYRIEGRVWMSPALALSADLPDEPTWPKWLASLIPGVRVSIQHTPAKPARLLSAVWQVDASFEGRVLRSGVGGTLEHALEDLRDELVEGRWFRSERT